MARLLVFFALMAGAVVAAGLFGALHNQASYTVAPSYFHEFKFAQFAIPGDQHSRVGAAIVGWHASWWMGVFIGLPAFFLGFAIIPDAARYLRRGLWAIGIVIATTAGASAVGFGIGVLWLDAGVVAQLPLPSGLSDPVGFARAGIMHDLSYFGGALGAIAACWYMWRARSKKEMKNAA
ncbi:hypothetical protein ACS3SW_09930 [Roseobacteraceae bacterium S113]